MSIQLPTLTSEQCAHEQRVTTHLQQLLNNTTYGTLSFAQFMQEVLYAPQLGYYSATIADIGQAGDFTTAPELSVDYSVCIAQQCAQIIKEIPHSVIIEYGAGSGKMAANIINWLTTQHCLPESYIIIEVSDKLQQWQQQTLQQQCSHYLHNIHWCQDIPTTFKGIVLANEVLDALPVERIHLNAHNNYQYHVHYTQRQWQWCLQSPHSTNIQARTASLRQGLSHAVLENGYSTEICLTYPQWLQPIAKSLQQGIVLLIDYGYAAYDYYHPQRSNGTLKCYFQHHMHNNPLINLGLQDISAHVDFTAVAKAAYDVGLNISGFTTQAFFLLSCGLIHTCVTETSDWATIAQQQTNKLLLHPNEMGELIKVMALNKNYSQPLLGFNLDDRRHQLSKSKHLS